MPVSAVITDGNGYIGIRHLLLIIASEYPISDRVLQRLQAYEIGCLRAVTCQRLYC